jgi:cytochrome bd-type quinol oxidase subunit 2
MQKEAAMPLFMLIGIAPIIPVILAYNLWVYRVFRHKVCVG